MDFGDFCSKLHMPEAVPATFRPYLYEDMAGRGAPGLGYRHGLLFISRTMDDFPETGAQNRPSNKGLQANQDVHFHLALQKPVASGTAYAFG